MSTTNAGAAGLSVAARDAGMNVATRNDVHKLHTKAVGLIGVLFLTLTGSAPMTAMLLNVPIAVGNGNGLGAPAAFVVATVTLLLFSVGYAAMARKVTTVGGFYSFISHGLGRDLGMAMGLGAVVAYSVFETALAGGFAYFANAKILELTGVNVAWPILAGGMIVLISLLTYFDVKLSTALLGVALVAEVIVMLVFDIGIFGHAGRGAHVQLSTLNPALAFQGFPAVGKLTAGAAGVGLFFAFWSWVGFEMAPNYGEESRDPKRIVPMSLYISVLALGVFYTLTCWAGVSAYGTFPDLINKAQNDSANFFFDPAAHLVGGWVKTAMSYLILTSSFACGMAFHNTAARYLYSLGRERVLPGWFGRTHHALRSPYLASFAQTGFALVVLAVFVIFGGYNDPNAQANGEVYGLLSLLGTMLIIAAQAIVSLAIIVYFWRAHRADFHWLETGLAPLAAFALQAYMIYLCIANIDVVGGGLSIANWIAPLDIVILLAGFAVAVRLKRRDPAKYAQIGRMIYEGVPDGPLVAGEHAEATLARGSAD
jgi:amino acid transporter